MAQKFDNLIQTAMYLGVNETAYPIDIFEVSRLLAAHPDVEENFNSLLALVEDKENHFTRWAAIRAITLMGDAALAKSHEVFARQLKIEDYELAKMALKKVFSAR